MAPGVTRDESPGEEESVLCDVDGSITTLVPETLLRPSPPSLLHDNKPLSCMTTFTVCQIRVKNFF